MLWEATSALLVLMGGMWGAAVWASFREDSTGPVTQECSVDRKQAA